MLHRWREVALENIIAEVDVATADRLETLLRRAFARPSRIERAIRAWATANEQARVAVEAMDGERTGYLRKLLIEAGLSPGVAETRALNWSYLGLTFPYCRPIR